VQDNSPYLTGVSLGQLVSLAGLGRLAGEAERSAGELKNDNWKK
jgi:hypothetical protein